MINIVYNDHQLVIDPIKDSVLVLNFSNINFNVKNSLNFKFNSLLRSIIRNYSNLSIVNDPKIRLVNMLSLRLKSMSRIIASKLE